MEKPLVLNGKTFISSRRAAETFGYTIDYIGQLCRAKKIKSVMVGRDRFVDYESINNYVLSLHEKTIQDRPNNLDNTENTDSKIKKAQRDDSEKSNLLFNKIEYDNSVEQKEETKNIVISRISDISAASEPIIAT